MNISIYDRYETDANFNEELHRLENPDIARRPWARQTPKPKIGLWNSIRSLWLGRDYFRTQDEDLQVKVCDALVESPVANVNAIVVCVENGIVTLKGSVNNRRDKRLAYLAVEGVFGVVEIKNELHIESYGTHLLVG